MSQALTMVRSFLPGSSLPHGADFSMTAQYHRCWPGAWRAADGLSGVWNCWWSYQDERVQGGHSRCMKGCRKPEIGPTHSPPWMQWGPLVLLNMSFQTSWTRVTGFKVLEMDILSPHPRPSELEALCLGHSDLHFEKPFRSFQCMLKCETHNCWCFRELVGRRLPSLGRW